MQHRPRKHFGQNFLIDLNVIQNILAVFNPEKSDKVIEIGPGLGALTSPLLNKLDVLTAIEIDRDLTVSLLSLPNAQKKLFLVNKDVLTIDFKSFGNKLRIIGNLPYNISTPLLFHLLSYSILIKDMHFMLQKEVVDRLAAEPGGKSFGRLSVMIQYFCKVEKLFEVPPEAFLPPPKVDSAIVRLIPYQESPYSSVDFSCFSYLIRCAFAMRRKTLANNLKSLISASDLSSIGIEPTRRPEQISIDEYVQIAKFIAK